MAISASVVLGRVSVISDTTSVIHITGTSMLSSVSAGKIIFSKEEPRHEVAAERAQVPDGLGLDAGDGAEDDVLDDHRLHDARHRRGHHARVAGQQVHDERHHKQRKDHEHHLQRRGVVEDVDL